jgi:Cu-Zn family superoxide dismutase
MVRHLIYLGVIAVLGAGCGEAKKGVVVARAEATIEARGTEPGADLAGTATFEEVDGQIRLAVTVNNAAPGTHGFHIHQTGDCGAAGSDGTTAGPHWNPEGTLHGQWGSGVHHLGDVGNFDVGADGVGTMTFSTDRWTIGTKNYNDIVGLAVIFHALADTYDPNANPPGTGGAGGRHGCGVIQRTF